MNKAVLFSAASDRWETPREVKEALYAEFALNFDPCPLDGTVNGLAPLFCRWEGKRVFCNPPYGPGIRAWLQRGFEAEIAVFLLPARTDTQWFHQVCLPHAREIRFLKGRLKFGNAPTGAPFPSMVVVLAATGLRRPRQGIRHYQAARTTSETVQLGFLSSVNNSLRELAVLTRAGSLYAQQRPRGPPPAAH